MSKKQNPKDNPFLIPAAPDWWARIAQEILNSLNCQPVVAEQALDDWERRVLDFLILNNPLGPKSVLNSPQLEHPLVNKGSSGLVQLEAGGGPASADSAENRAVCQAWPAVSLLDDVDDLDDLT